MLLDRFTQLVDSQPEAIFFSGDNYEVTFEELSYAMGGRTKSLAGVGITNGLRVAIILADSRDIIEILLSCWQLGAIPVLVSSQSTPMEKDQFLESSQPHIIITNWEISEDLIPIDVPVFPIEELSQGFGGCAPSQLHDVSKLDQTRLILFTSGSTGTPKAVQLTERNLIESATAWHEQLQFTRNDIYLNCLPMHHIGGISIFIRSFIYGFSSYQLNEFNIDAISNLIESKHITLISMVPTMLQRLLDNTKNKLPQSLRGIIVSGGPSTESLMNRCITHDIPVYKSYGMTETSSGICGFWLHEYPSKYESVGLPFLKTKFQVNESVLHVSGPTIMDGYFGEEAIQSCLDTGDFASIDEEGFIYINLRRDVQIVTGGENVNPKEVEDILLSHPQITFAKVYGEPDEEWGQMVVAEISTDLQTNEINEWLSGKISEYKIPKVYYLK
jgi:O-succinylbenzoic acid--CoA ligase|tara:strand:+ start:3071 stop:4402 length:1332 start_codon:yes stop_codon:yes gene_type:complete